MTISTTLSVMASIPSWDDIRQMLADLTRSQAEDRLQMQQSREETERAMRASREETDRAMRVSREETEQSIRETERILQQAADRQEKRADQLDRQLKQLGKQLGELGNRLGEFVEYMVEPAVVNLFRDRGLNVTAVMHDIEVLATAQREGMQIDLLVLDGDTLVIVECKSKLTSAHIAEHATRMEKFRRIMPRYQDCTALSALAAMVAEPEVVREAIEAGFFVITQSGESVVIQNDTDFTPRVW